jgi:hypothetical protein
MLERFRNIWILSHDRFTIPYQLLDLLIKYVFTGVN